LVCSGKKVSTKHNSLLASFPEIAAQAYGWNPETVTAKSGQRKKWQCGNGHTWESAVSTRTAGSGCPVCANQEVLTGYNDLGTTHPALALEANGWDPKKKIAGSNKKVAWKCRLGHSWEAVLASRALGGNGCPICSGLKTLAGFNDLMTTHPQIAKDAFNWDPTLESFGSHKNVEWLCPSGHVFRARINHRATGVSNCHFCSGHKVLPGFNDLATTNPKLASEAHGWDTTKVSEGSSYKKFWKCSEGHIWKAAISDRKLTGCPSCSKTGFDPNKKGWIYFAEHEQWGMLQIGISNQIENRMARHKQFGWNVLEVRGPMDGLVVQEWETSILHSLKRRGAILGGRKDKPDESRTVIERKNSFGSESWLASSCPVTGLKELMNWVETDESK
jgi:hypothetical protein